MIRRTQKIRWELSKGRRGKKTHSCGSGGSPTLSMGGDSKKTIRTAKVKGRTQDCGTIMDESKMRRTNLMVCQGEGRAKKLLEGELE